MFAVPCTLWWLMRLRSAYISEISDRLLGAVRRVCLVSQPSSLDVRVNADPHASFATNFAISHRRMMVPINKRWEASFARLQIVQRDSVVQLLGVFKDFQYGTCMNFVIKSTDKFETFTRSEQHGVRIVDAKFPLPKKPTEENSDFMCLDMPEYPSEHDDITVGFESEAGMFSSVPHAHCT